MGKRKLACLSESSEEEEEKEGQSLSEGGDEDAIEAKPIGDVLKKSGRGRAEKRFYQSFQLDGTTYQLEDPVLLTPEEKNQKPYVAIIKEIKQSKSGSMTITGQWFYRPEETDRKSCGNWAAQDARELFYSFHTDEVAAESVMHKCVIHFIPLHKQSPLRSKHPGFVVRRVYDAVEKKLFKLTDKDYEDAKQLEIDLLVKKTQQVLGDLPDMEPEEMIADLEETEKNKRLAHRKMVSPISVLKEDNFMSEGKVETPGSCASSEPQGGGGLSDAFTILQTNNAFTGTSLRDRWLERILQSVKHVCMVEKQIESSSVKLSKDSPGNNSKSTTPEEAVKTASDEKAGGDLQWPKVAIGPVTSLERIVHETLGSDPRKYGNKMRQLEFNLKNGTFLVRRFLKGELEPSKILSMSPVELKEGLFAEEKNVEELEEPKTMQMVDVLCTICAEKKVGVKDIIHVGYGDRYQLECLKCGNAWYSSRDAILSVTLGTEKSRVTVGTAPSKLEETEKESATSPSEPEKSLVKETTALDNSSLQKGAATLLNQKSH